MKTIAVIMTVLVMAAAAMADDLQVAIEKQMKDAAGTLATVRFSLTNQEGMKAQAETLAVCIDGGQRIFMTLTIPTNIPLSSLSEFRIIRPSEPDEELKAELLGMDLDTGLTFVRCVDNVSFKAVSLVHSTALRVGDPVISVGLMSQNAGYEYMADLARISARVRAPGERLLVSGGSLGLGSAPVFNMAGQTVGLVAPERDTSGRMFIPVEEISYVVTDIPKGGKPRARAWMGLLRVRALSGRQIKDREIKRKAAIEVLDIMPGAPAAAAGLKEGDVIVAMGGTSLEAFPALNAVVAAFQRHRSRLKPGSRVLLTVVRDNKEMEIPVTAAVAPLSNSELPREFVKEIGVGGRPLTAVERYLQKVPATQGGLIIDYVRPGSGASQQFKPGDWVVSINDSILEQQFGAFEREVRKALADTGRKDIAFRVRRRAEDGRIHDVILTFPKGN